MPRKPKYRKPYPPEFRREAVALYARTEKTLGEIAADLGVSRESLRLWVQQAQIERGERDGLTGDERRSCASCGGGGCRSSKSGRAWKKPPASSRRRARPREPGSGHRGGGSPTP